MLARIFIALCLLAVTIFACDYDDCDHPDEGSCGNACCRLGIYIKESTSQVMNKLKKSIDAGGPDGRYIPQLTAEGTMTFGDLTMYDNGVDYIGQAWHTTTNLEYNDTLNFNLKPAEFGSGTMVTAFSISQTAGSYGDDGQNYFNLKQLFDAIEWESGSYEMFNADVSCPASSKKSRHTNKKLHH